LRIGKHVYVGPGCLMDLADAISIDDDAAISARVTIVTHSDVGARPLQKIFPRQSAPVRIQEGAWIGVNTTILHGVTIGERAVVGACSLVNKCVPAAVVAYGTPCQVVRDIRATEGQLGNCQNTTG